MLANHIGSISCHQLLIALGAGTHTHTPRHTHTEASTESILRNQAQAWFNKTFKIQFISGSMNIFALIWSTKNLYLPPQTFSDNFARLALISIYIATS